MFIEKKVHSTEILFEAITWNSLLKTPELFSSTTTIIILLEKHIFSHVSVFWVWFSKTKCSYF